MNYSHPQIRLVAQRLPFFCALYFVAFAFFFLYVLECDVLAQAQYQLSGGATVYHPLLAALLSTLALALLGLFLSRLHHWLPLRMKALSWFLPFMLVGALTHWRYPQYGDAGTAPGWMTVVFLLIFYGLALFLGRMFVDSSKERETFSTYAWPNALLLILFSVICINISNTDIVVHRTLAANRYVGERNYEKALLAARWEQHPSRQLAAMTALSLSETGQMGEALFTYSQPYGSEGLLPSLSDSLLFHNLPAAVGLHLGYKKGDSTETTFFLRVISQMPKARPAVRDYLLCAYLLDRDIERFASLLLEQDSLSPALPRHYREAMMLRANFYPETLRPKPVEKIGRKGKKANVGATQRKIESEDVDVFQLAVPLLGEDIVEQFTDFMSTMNERGAREERELRCRERFGKTYWYYYFFEKK